MALSPSNRYSKPYRNWLSAGAKGYKPFNGFIGGDVAYGPRVVSLASLQFNFVGVPANGSSVQIPDGPPNSPGTPTLNFVYTYSGAPGPGIIPLVAGGGTAAQAAAATQLAMAAQLTKWTVTNPSAIIVLLVQKQPGISPSPIFTGATNISVVASLSAIGNVLPGRSGKIYSIMPG